MPSVKIHRRFGPGRKIVLHPGDCIDLLQKLPDHSVDLTVTSPPYCMGKEYERTDRLGQFVEAHWKILPEVVRATKPGGSICWQVGYHNKNGVLTPLDFIINDMMKRWPEMILRNRVIWTFGHGLHGSNRFSGRHETILWYTKGEDYKFNLDGVRIPQKYPGKRYYRGPKKGEFSCNPLGKNPGDVWELPNVKARHVEKTNHPCQFPVALVQRLVRAFTDRGDVVLDPFMGSGTTGATAILEGRRFVGAEIKNKYYHTATKRCREAVNNKLLYRDIEKPIQLPDLNTEVARNPFLTNGKEHSNGHSNKITKEKTSRINFVPLHNRNSRRNDTCSVLGIGR